MMTQIMKPEVSDPGLATGQYLSSAHHAARGSCCPCGQGKVSTDLHSSRAVGRLGQDAVDKGCGDVGRMPGPAARTGPFATGNQSGADDVYRFPREGDQNPKLDT